MSYRLRTDETLTDGVRRVVHEQTDRAVAQLNSRPEGVDAAIHDARKRFKKIRGVLRLVRDEIGPDVYHRENAFYRDAGRRLAPARDSVVMIETLDALVERFDRPNPMPRFDRLRARLVARHGQALRQLVDKAATLEAVTASLELAQVRISRWPILRDEAAAFGAGLRRVYKRGRKAMAAAYDEPSVENFHEWRKRGKYLWYHMRLLSDAWPGPLQALATELHQLTNYQGDDHDLAVLSQLIRDEPALLEPGHAQRTLLDMIDRRQTELQGAARALGQRIYYEKPNDFYRRVSRYWDIWRLTTREGEQYDTL